MFNQTAFGEKLKNHRKLKNMTQEEAAEKIGVSGQAVSKWEKGDCLPDCYNLKMLGKIYQVSVDTLLDVEEIAVEKIVETININGAVFELVKRPEKIYAGGQIDEQIENFDNINGRVLPERDVHISVNFWREEPRGIIFAREVTTMIQPDGVYLYKIPASLYLRVYTDKNAAKITGKETCEPWELFAYMWNYVMPNYKLKMFISNNANYQFEVYDSGDGSHGSGWGYAAVERIV
jgi:transcriptional regulator with XRE-family HTH domain